MTSRKITCLVSGKSYTFSKDYYDKKVDEYGDEDEGPALVVLKRPKPNLYIV